MISLVEGLQYIDCFPVKIVCLHGSVFNVFVKPSVFFQIQFIMLKSPKLVSVFSFECGDSLLFLQLCIASNM